MRSLDLCSATVLGLIAMGSGELDASPPCWSSRTHRSPRLSRSRSPTVRSSPPTQLRRAGHDSRAEPRALVRRDQHGRRSQGRVCASTAGSWRVRAIILDKKIGLFEVETTSSSASSTATPRSRRMPSRSHPTDAGTSSRHGQMQFSSGTRLRHAQASAPRINPFPIHRGTAFSPDSTILASGEGKDGPTTETRSPADCARTLEGIVTGSFPSRSRGWSGTIAS